MAKRTTARRARLRMGARAGCAAALMVAAAPGSAGAADLFSSRAYVEPSTDPGFSSRLESTALLDVDGDHDLDIASLSGTDQGYLVHVARNDGTGTFAPQPPPETLVPSPITYGVGTLTATDADLDGNADLLVTTPSALSLLRGDGTGRFAAPILLRSGTFTVATANFTGDSRPDVVANSGDRVLVLRGAGTSLALLGNATLAEARGGGPIRLHDLSGDGKLDIVVGGQDGVEVFRINGTGVPSRIGVGRTTEPVTDLVVGDVTDDGPPDVAAITDGEKQFCEDSLCEEDPPYVFDPDNAPTLHVFAGTGTGALTSRRRTIHVWPGRAAVLGHFDGDAQLDLGASFTEYHYDVGEVFIETGQNFRQQLEGESSDYVTDLESGDLNGDGRDDLVMVAGQGETLEVLLATPPTGTSTFLPAHQSPSNGQAGPVSAGVLAKGATYEVTVSGTYSPFPTSLYDSPQHKVCGDPDILRRRSADAEFNFGVIARHTCSGTTAPARASRLNWDYGGGYRDPQPVGGTANGPAADHTYTYRVVGRGKQLKARLRDAPTTDNSGGLTITVRRLP